MESPEDNNLTLAAVDRQPRLFLDSELDQRMDEESVNSAMVPKPRHTADRVLRDRPEDYRLAVELIGQGQLSQIEIARLCKMSEHTLMAVSGPGNVPGKRTAGPGGSAAPAASDPEDVEEVPE
jgi:hypothetical protein